MVKKQPKVNELLLMILNDIRLNRALVLSQQTGNVIFDAAKVGGLKVDDLNWLRATDDRVNR